MESSNTAAIGWCAAFVVASASQWALQHGGAFVPVGMVLFFVVFPVAWFSASRREPSGDVNGSAAADDSTQSLRRAHLDRVALVATVAAGALAIGNASNVLSGGAWLVGVGAFLTAYAPAKSSGALTRWRARWREVLAASALVVAGSAARLALLDQYPAGMHGDEGEFGSAALSLIEGQWLNLFSTDIFQQHVNAFAFLQAATMRVFGEDVAGVRVLSGCAGSLTLPFVYVLARNMFGPALALIAGTLFAFAPWHLSFSRMAMNDILVPLFLVAGLHWLYRGLRRNRTWDYALAGVSLGMGLWADHNNKSMILGAVLGAVLVYLALTQWRRRRAAYAKVAILLLGLVVVMLPVWEKSASQGLLFWPIVQLVKFRFFLADTYAPFAVYGTTNPLIALLYQAEHSLFAFNHFGDASVFNAAGRRPVFDNLTAVFFVVGLAASLWRWREPRHGILLIWWGIGLVVSVLANQPPQAHHLLPALVPAYLFAALGICELSSACASILHWKSPEVPAVVAALLLCVIAYLDLRAYFSPANTDPNWLRNTTAGRLIRAWAPDHEVYFLGLPEVSADYGSIRFAAHLAPVVDLDDARSLARLRKPPERDLAFLVTRTRLADLADVQRYFPCGTTKHWQRDDGEIYLAAYLVTRVEAASPPGSCAGPARRR